MAKQRKILLDNALTAWAAAIRYCDQIYAGRVTLDVRKSFVSSLQNAVELFLKQIMLDNCDYRVAEPRKVDAQGEPAKSYYAASDLNAYFEHLGSDTRNKFASIEFSKFYDLHKELLRSILQPGDSYKEQLRLVNELRNNETHFYIGRDEYLSESDFLKLYNFMIDFYQVIHDCGLLPFWGVAGSEHKKIEFSRAHKPTFSYISAIKTAPMVKKIESIANSVTFQDTAPTTVYEMASALASQIQGISDAEFEELWAYVEVLDQYNMIQLEEADMYEEDELIFEESYFPPYKKVHYDYVLMVNLS